MMIFERPGDDSYSELPAPVGTDAKFGHFPSLRRRPQLGSGRLKAIRIAILQELSKATARP